MVAPYPTRERKPFKVNDDPRRLDSVFDRFLGPRGASMLTEEIKWLTVTHKSFDHGRRGFNDRLAFFGKGLGHFLL
jgi:large subunit ribosomal protein L15